MTRTSFLKRLIGIAGFGFLSLPDVSQKQKVYLLQAFVAGFRFHRGMELLEFIQENDIIELRREPENEHDAFAIALYWQQEKIGYLPATVNELPARLMDAKALPLLGVITHLNREVKPWENVAIALYFLQDKHRLAPHGQYLALLDTPLYTTSRKKPAAPPVSQLPDLFDVSNRVIAIDDVEDPAARDYFERHYAQFQITIGGRRYLQVPDDGIYTYLYNVDARDWLTDDEDRRWLEFVFNPDVA